MRIVRSQCASHGQAGKGKGYKAHWQYGFGFYKSIETNAIASWHPTWPIQALPLSNLPLSWVAFHHCGGLHGHQMGLA